MAVLNFGGANFGSPALFHAAPAGNDANLVALPSPPPFPPVPGYWENTGSLNTIDVDQPVQMTFQWTVGGMFCTLWVGKWTCEAFFESLGPAIALPTQSKSVAHIATFADTTYTAVVDVPAGSVAAGVYRVTARVMITEQNGLHPVVAFADLGVVEYYEA